MRIALLVDLLKPRVIKIKSALEKLGINVMTLTNKDNANFLPENKSFYKDTILFNPNDFIGIENLVKKLNVDVCHIFCEAHISPWIEFIIKELKGKAKTTFDQYDSYRDFVTGFKDEFSDREKFCLEEADGVCCRSFKINYYDKYDYNIKNKLIFFDYCWGDFEKNLDKNSNDKLKVVYGGRLLAATVYSSDFYIKKYYIERIGFDYVSKIINEFSGEFIIIPTIDINEPCYSEYRNLSRRYSSTIFQKPMGLEDLIKFESNMDYGIDCLDLENVMKRFGHSLEGVRRENKYYATNKFFDYLDAGVMPIYGRDYELFGKYLATNGGAIYCKLEDMRDMLPFLKENREKYKVQAKEARNILSIDKQIPKLLEFYQYI